jgi:hypothetical protein
MSWLSEEGLDKIVSLQKENPQMILCGSVALIVASILDERKVADVDFTAHRDYFDKLKLGRLDKDDPYKDAEEDGYTSYHKYIYINNNKRLPLNVLIHEDPDAYITIQTVEYRGRTFTIQKVDDILRWKKKYNRDKDIKDLENIAIKAVEELFLEEK